MDDDFDLRKFSNQCRLFPLPNVVLFPHAILPLHIFEPRYRQLTEDALADDKLVAIAQLQPTLAGAVSSLGSPPVEEIACLGLILRHERLSDGRFNFLLLGRKRVRLVRELPTEKLYRIAEAEILEDEFTEENLVQNELITLFRQAFVLRHELDPDLDAIFNSTVSLGVLTDIMAHALGLPAAVNQILLSCTHVGRRVDILLGILRRMLEGSPQPFPESMSFPPPFSAN
ncbi:MAG: LON peptidase substrate-binding domain-containing protein [Isosphaeraceae bacterium]